MVGEGSMIMRPMLNRVRPVEGALQGSAKRKAVQDVEGQPQSGLLEAGRPSASLGRNERNLEAS